MDKQTFKVGEAPWENNNLGTFKVGEAPWELEEQKPKVSGLQSFIQDITEAPLKFLSTAQAIGRGVSGFTELAFGNKEKASELFSQQDKITNEGIDYGYFGNVKPLGSIKEAIGAGAEIGSYAIGGGGGATTVKTGLKGLIGRGIKEGITTGASSGALMGFGDSMQEAESKPMDIAYNTLFGAGVGGVTGGVLGGVTPIVSKGAKEALKFTKVPELQTKLSEGYQKIFNPNARQIKADTRFGNNSFDFLAQEMPDLPIKVESNGKIQADEAIEMAKMKYSAEAAAYKPIIRNSGKYVDIDEVIAAAKANAKKEFDGTDLIKAEQQIDNEVNAYLANTPQDVNVTANGKRFITLARADDIKSYSWARGRGWGTPEAEVWNDTNNIIGHAIKDAIEKELPEAPIKAMNKRLGQWKNAIDMLEKRNGQVSGSGGKLSKLFKTQTGSIVGGLIGTGTGDDNRIIGGVTGAGAGFMTASALAAIMSNPNVRLFAIRQLLQRLNKAGRKDMIQEAEQILQQQASRYLLPAANKSSYVEKPIIVGKPGQRLESTGTRPVVQSSPSALQAKAPSVAPTTQDIKNSTITNTIDETANRASQQGAQSAYGGVAGIEITKDENGKTVVNFDPEKAIVGIIGMTAYNKFGDKIKNEIKDNLSKRLRERVLNELKNFDDNLVRVTGMLGNRLEGGDEGALLGLSRMKEKALTKNLSTSDINETIGLLKRQGVDLMKEETESALKSAQSATTNTLNASIKKAKASGQSFDEWVKGQATELNYKNLQENDYSIKAFGKDFNEPVEYFRAGQVRKNGDIWLTDNQAGAMQYSSAGGGTKVGRYIVQSKKPLIIDTAGGKYASGNIDINKILTKEEIAQGYTNNPDIKKKLIDYAKNNGYDAVQFADSFPDGEGGMRSLVVWDKNQVKTRSQLKAEWDKIK